MHPQRSEQGWRELRHFFLVFHDEMFEALARQARARLRTSNLTDLLTETARQIQ